MPSIKAVIFDLDGVIVASEPVYNELFLQWARDHAVEFYEADFQRYIGSTWQDLLQTINTTFQKSFDVRQEQNDIVQRIIKHIAQVGIPLKENIEETLQQLKPHYRLGVTSSSPRLVVERILKHHGLFNYFDVITTIEDVRYPKPHPEPYQITMRKLKTKPETTVIIEDSLNGARAGVAAGAFVYVLPDARLPDEKFAVLLNNTGKIIHGFDELIQDLLG
ncbi:MAG: HAD family phosphatase [Patescibacteria group bacterium]|jgi:HAD superfamily hydrolase (TIGR01509 family)